MTNYTIEKIQFLLLAVLLSGLNSTLFGMNLIKNVLPSTKKYIHKTHTIYVKKYSHKFVIKILITGWTKNKKKIKIQIPFIRKLKKIEYAKMLYNPKTLLVQYCGRYSGFDLFDIKTRKKTNSYTFNCNCYEAKKFTNVFYFDKLLCAYGKNIKTDNIEKAWIFDANTGDKIMGNIEILIQNKNYLFALKKDIIVWLDLKTNKLIKKIQTNGNIKSLKAFNNNILCITRKNDGFDLYNTHTRKYIGQYIRGVSLSGIKEIKILKNSIIYLSYRNGYINLYDMLAEKYISKNIIQDKNNIYGASIINNCILRATYKDGYTNLVNIYNGKRIGRGIKIIPNKTIKYAQIIQNKTLSITYKDNLIHFFDIKTGKHIDKEKDIFYIRDNNKIHFFISKTGEQINKKPIIIKKNKKIKKFAIQEPFTIYIEYENNQETLHELDLFYTTGNKITKTTIKIINNKDISSCYMGAFMDVVQVRYNDNTLDFFDIIRRYNINGAPIKVYNNKKIKSHTLNFPILCLEYLNNQLDVFNMKTGNKTNPQTIKFKKNKQYLKIHNKTILIGYTDNTVDLFDINTGQKNKSHTIKENILCLEYLKNQFDLFEINTGNKINKKTINANNKKLILIKWKTNQIAVLELLENDKINLLTIKSETSELLDNYLTQNNILYLFYKNKVNLFEKSTGNKIHTNTYQYKNETCPICAENLDKMQAEKILITSCCKSIICRDCFEKMKLDSKTLHENLQNPQWRQEYSTSEEFIGWPEDKEYAKCPYCKHSPLKTIKINFENKQECSICLDNKNIKKFATLLCAHKFCIECLNNAINLSIREQKTIYLKCPNPTCNKKIKDIDIKKFINNPDKLKKLYEIYTKEWLLNKQKHIKYCPTLNCKSYFLHYNNSRETMTCPQCRKKYCANCLLPHEKRIKCKKAKDNNKANQLSEEWKQKNSRRCPNCKVNIIKSGGCRHLQCKCKYKMCWKCMGPDDHPDIFCTRRPWQQK